MTILPEKITIGSRQSPLAKKQVEIFVQKFKEIYGKNISSILDFKYLKTSGDKLLDKNISKFGNKGLFTKELDEAQLKNQIDVSIHSLKDLPTRINDKLCISYNGIREETFMFTVYDRFSNVVYSTNNIQDLDCNNGWDGTYQETGNPLLTGVYIYEVSYQDFQGWKHHDISELFIIK